MAFLLRKFIPAGTLGFGPLGLGPMVAIARDDIVAVEQAYFEQKRQYWRACVHLRGGTSMLVDEPFDKVVELYEQAKLPT